MRSKTILAMAVAALLSGSDLVEARATDLFIPHLCLDSDAMVAESRHRCALPISKKNVMLRVKEKALESSMREIRDERRRLERKLEKGEISKLMYEAEIQKLVRRGKSVLKAQSIVAAKKNGSD